MRSDEMVDEIFVLVDIEDEMTFDTEFQHRVRFGSWSRGCSEFTERNRKLIVRASERDPLMPESFKNKFLIEVYTDRLSDMMRSIVFSKEKSRTLTYLGAMTRALVPADIDPDDIDEDECPLIVRHVYSLATVGDLAFDDMPEAADGSTTLATSSEVEEENFMLEQDTLTVDDSEEQEDSEIKAGQTHTAPKMLH
jgi:hypothetical protein